MKKTLFGSLGELIKGNVVTIILALCVVAAGALSFYTINDINEKLDNQKLANPNSVSQISSQEEIAQDVQNEAENVPLKESEKPTATPKAEEEKAAAVQPEGEAADSAQVSAKFILPVQGEIFAAFSGDELVYNQTMDDWRTHNGIDIRANKDVGVKAGCDATVAKIYEDGMLGWTVELDCGGFTARYSGLGDNVMVKEGSKVKQGDTIGVVGEIPLELAEQSHVHLEIIKDGKAVNPNEMLG